MPDISMCMTDECPSKELCYRYKAEPNSHWQAYSAFTPGKNTGKCGSFWPIEDAPTKIRGEGE